MNVTWPWDWVIAILILCGFVLLGWYMMWQSELDIRRARRWTQVRAFRRDFDADELRRVK